MKLKLSQAELDVPVVVVDYTTFTWRYAANGLIVIKNVNTGHWTVYEPVIS
jgi:hypothetical protein